MYNNKNMAQFSNTLDPRVSGLINKLPPKFQNTVGNLASTGSNIAGAVKNTIGNGLGLGTPSSQISSVIQPSTPVKSTFVGANGDKKTEYHAPAKVDAATSSQPPVPTVPPAPAPAMIQNGAVQTPEPPKIDPRTGLLTAYGLSLNQPTQSGATSPPTQNQTGTGSPQTPQQQYLNQGLEYQNEAAQLGRHIQNAEDAVRSNPNYSLDTQTGAAGLIQRNIGAQMQGLAQTGGNYIDAARIATPQVAGYGQTSIRLQEPLELMAEEVAVVERR